MKQIVSGNSYDIVCVSETHFHDGLTSAECEIPGYNSYRGDRDFKLDRSTNDNQISDCGGSVIYVKTNIQVQQLIKGPDSVAVYLECDLGKVIVACIYRSPSLNKHQDIKLLNFMKGIFKDQTSIAKFCFGDFNLSQVSWLSGTITGSSDSNNMTMLMQKMYLDLIHELGLSWLLTSEVTRRRLNTITGMINESLLDQLIFTDESLVNEFKLGPHLGKSDHVTLRTELNVSHTARFEENKVVDEERRCWSQVSTEDILEWSKEMSWDFKNNELNDMSVNDIWSTILEKLNVLSQRVPFQKCTNNININYSSPWANRSLKRAIRNKNKAWNLSLI